ncbi:hypothetical protein GCM10008995_02610 [Halobellus salinus]|uniref:Tyr recombinase domain-containing protein n=1 Tax=Halobellus salinus TaxID=931585 RepID=A0A830EP39_9EURY|nr:hypothetical protein [Halobellus salinus]GGI96056.1 hypothetical protein GCM10008995_02610 [Halobellus salinus]SMP12823.1 Phage integrase family protein [Halobellus salinus]
MKWTKEKLQTRIPAKMREERRAQGLNPDKCPTRQWLRENGYSGIEGFARRNDMTVQDVLIDICGFDSRSSKPLGIEDAEARRLVEEWLDVEQDVFKNWGDSRVQDARTHVRTLVKVAYEALGTTDLVSILRSDPSVEANKLLQLFRALNTHLESQGAASNYTRSLERFAEYLSFKEEIESHKVGELRDKMGYTYERESPEHRMVAKQIRECWRATESLEEKALVVVLSLSGTRRTEPTDTTVADLRLDRADPYIVFDEDRKTGAATVPIMAGVEVLEKWVDELKETEHWDGKWLFPSKKSQDGSRGSGWVSNTIGEIVERAGITFPDGEQPTSKHFRSFWYEHYSEARLAWLNKLEIIAEEQGVSSAEIIDKHYLTGKAERDHFRHFARSLFAAVFGDELVRDLKEMEDAREEERDEMVQRALDDYTDELRAELQAADDDADDSATDGPTHESPVAAEPVSAWTQARVRAEHAAVAASDVVDGYPPSPRRAVGIAVGLVCWAAIIGTIWGMSGVFYVDPISGAYSASPATITGLVLGLVLVVVDLPEFTRAQRAGENHP